MENRRSVFTLLCALLCGGALAQSIGIVSSTAVPLPSAPDAAHELRLAVYLFEGTRWEPGQALAALALAAPVLAQCAIAVSAELHLLRAPRRFRYLFTPDSRELLRELAPPKPALFLVEDTRNRPAFDAEAVGRGNSRTRPEMVNTVWVTFGTPDLPLVLAHELSHLLADSGEHSSEPGNLMREETAPENTRLTETQCNAIRTRGAVGGLITPRMVKP